MEKLTHQPQEILKPGDVIEGESLLESAELENKAEAMADAAVESYMSGAMPDQKLIRSLRPDSQTRRLLRECLIRLADDTIAKRPELSPESQLNLIKLKSDVLVKAVLKDRAQDLMHEVQDGLGLRD